MDIATLIGMVLSFGLVSMALVSGGSPVIFVDGASMLIVFGGTLGAILTHYPLGTVLSIGKVIRKTIVGKTQNTVEILDQILDFANRARREGILALEPLVKGLDDAYLRKGLQLTVDGLEPESIQSIMEAEINNVEMRHEIGVELLAGLAAYAPALGMIGTVIGLVQMLQNMSDPSTIGPAMAVALITTFYGAVLANLVFIPLMGKLKHRSKEEIHIMEMQMEGVLGISRGDNPRIIVEKLSSFQPPKERKTQ
jgi:chemotaxis protein MotA